MASANKSSGKRRGVRSANEEKKAAPEEKPKSKKEEKREDLSLDDVMLAEKETPRAAPAEPEKVAAKSNDKGSSDKGSSDIDDLLGEKPAKAPAQNRSIDDLLDGAVEKKGSAKQAAAPASNLPETPSRDDVLAAMRGVESAVQACGRAEGVTGKAEVQLEVASSGKVSSADVSGVSDSVGACIQRAVRSAKFPKFEKPSFAVKFPYRLK